MLKRFCAYGFLKNQRYFEPFIVLAFLDKGIDFFQIGLLVAIRELVVNLTEILSGAIADVYGRRVSMVASFIAYSASFAVFGLTRTFIALAAGMVLYGIGDAFRTGTHKAMIFTWLRLHGRSDERTEVYGYTRSWSKLGSALSVVIGTALVLTVEDYSAVFYLAIIPNVLNIANLATYPKNLDIRGDERPSVTRVLQRLRDAMKNAAQRVQLRTLLVESLSFEGSFTVAKDYLQPALKAAAVGAGAFLALDSLEESQRVALLVGPVYFALFLLSAWASRQAGAFRDRFGDEDRAATVLWLAFSGAFAAMLVGVATGVTAAVITVFVFLYVLQNFWRPILIARIDTHTSAEEQATMLSVEHQAKSLGAMIIAPLVGFAVDATGSLWPVAVMGLGMAGLAMIVRRVSRPAAVISET